MDQAPVRVLALTRYDRRGASSRYRTLQYAQPLRELGIDMTCRPLVDSDYLDRRYAGGQRISFPMVAGFLRRAIDLIRCGGFDVVWLEKEALPWLPECVERALINRRVPLVVDFDDATFHFYDQHHRPSVRHWLGRKHDAIMARSACVTVGNAYLRHRALAAGARKVQLLPTAVDLTRYAVRPPASARPAPLVIGWIGTPITQRYLSVVAEALATVAQERPLVVHAIGASNVHLPGVQVRCLEWSEESEVEMIRQCDIGIMPLTDSPIERGKSGLKLIQYMAAGLPVVGSPVGVNTQLIREHHNGFSPVDAAGWANALRTLADDSQLRMRMGRCGRQLVEEHYQLAVTSGQLAQILTSAAGAARTALPAAA